MLVCACLRDSHEIHVLDVVGVVDGMVDETDAVRGRVAARRRQVRAQDGVVERVQERGHRVESLVVVPHLVQKDSAV